MGQSLESAVLSSGSMLELLVAAISGTSRHSQKTHCNRLDTEIAKKSSKCQVAASWTIASPVQCSAVTHGSQEV